MDELVLELLVLVLPAGEQIFLGLAGLGPSHAVAGGNDLGGLLQRVAADDALEFFQDAARAVAGLSVVVGPGDLSASLVGAQNLQAVGFVGVEALFDARGLGGEELEGFLALCAFEGLYGVHGVGVSLVGGDGIAGDAGSVAGGPG